jgi:transposase-like protein
VTAGRCGVALAIWRWRSEWTASEVLGMWFQANEGAKFWMQVLTELKQRGVNDILITCVDGLKGFPEAIEAVFPVTMGQTCIVQLVGSLRPLACAVHGKQAHRCMRDSDGPAWCVGG